MAQGTDREKAYQTGIRDGYQLAKAELQAETDKAIDRLNAKTAELDAEADAVRAVFARLRTIDSATDIERDPATRLN